MEIQISAHPVQESIKWLFNLQHFVPKLFARKPRNPYKVARWKATEYSQFLLYTGKIILKSILPQTVYNHFLVVSVASYILVSPK